MLSFDRRTLFLTLTALPLAGCGFTPVYQSGGAAGQLQGRIRTGVIKGRDGFNLVKQIEQGLGSPNAGAPFSMQVDLSVTEDTLILNATTGIARYTLNAVAAVVVKDIANNSVVFQDRMRETTGYSGTSQTGYTNAARLDAHMRLMTALGDQIVLRLASSAQSWAG